MDAYFVSSFFHLDLSCSDVEDGIHCLNPCGDRQWKSKKKVLVFNDRSSMSVYELTGDCQTPVISQAYISFTETLCSTIESTPISTTPIEIDEEDDCHYNS